MFAIKKKCLLCSNPNIIFCPICNKFKKKEVEKESSDEESSDEESIDYDEYVLNDYESDLELAIKLSLEIKNKCRICFTEEIDTVFTKCGHMFWCYDCAHSCKKRCPICRVNDNDIIKIFTT